MYIIVFKDYANFAIINLQISVRLRNFNNTPFCCNIIKIFIQFASFTHCSREAVDVTKICQGSVILGESSNDPCLGPRWDLKSEKRERIDREETREFIRIIYPTWGKRLCQTERYVR